jgi:hypothetical protein
VFTIINIGLNKTFIGIDLPLFLFIIYTFQIARHKTYKRYSKHIAVVSILGRDELTKSFMPFLCLKLKIGPKKWCNG